MKEMNEDKVRPDEMEALKNKNAHEMEYSIILPTRLNSC